MNVPVQENAAEQVTINDLDTARGLSLATMIGWILILIAAIAFGGSIFANAPILVLANTPVFNTFFFCGIISLAMLGVGLRLAYAQYLTWAGRLIVGGIVCTFLLCQMLWIWDHGLDAFVLTSLALYIIPLGLAYVLNGIALLFLTAILSSLLTGLLVFAYPPFLQQTVLVGEVLSSWLITILLIWIIAMLIFASAITYNRALEKLGSLELAFKRAQQLDDLKDQFITHVNHELRTPIMTLQGSIDYLHDSWQSMRADQVQKLFAQAMRSAERLNAHLASILDVRNIEQSSQSWQATVVDVSEAFMAARSLVDPFSEYPIVATLADESFIWGDAGFLQQIFVNLLGNAIKYSPDRALITVKASRLALSTRSRTNQNPPAVIEIQIHDHGQGIPPDQIPLLFHRFVRLARDLASNIPGSGVGLYTCKLLTERMGGTINIESAGIPGQGTTCIIRLPAADRHQPERRQITRKLADRDRLAPGR